MPKKLLLFICMLLLLSLPVPAFEDSDIDFLENSLYHRLYSNDSLGERINRLENDILGMSQTGDIDARIEKLLLLNENRFNVAIPEINKSGNQKKEGKIKRFFNGVSDIFSQGNITGFTPPLGTSYYPNGLSSFGNYNNRGYFNNYLNPNAPGLLDELPSYCQYYGRRTNYGYNPINSTYRMPGFQQGLPKYREYYQNGLYRPNYDYYRNYMQPDIFTKSSVRILN